MKDALWVIVSAITVLCAGPSGCAQATPQTETTTHYVARTQQTRAPRQTERFRGLMSEHFGFTVWARDATTIGDIAAARDALLLLGNYAYDDVVPGAWLPRVRALQEDAVALARVTSLESLAQGIARIGAACGECHAATGGGPAVGGIAPALASVGDDSFPDRMFRHRRAIAALWLGLVAPSDALWNEGASHLVSVSSELQVESPLAPEFKDALGHLQQLGAKAKLARNRPERVLSYAELLASCANCHQRKWPAIY